MARASGKRDHVDRLRAQWARELPDLDTEPMAVFGRAWRLANLVAPGIEATFARHGLDRGTFDVLATLRRAGPPFSLTPTDLYTSMMISSGGLTHRLDRLEKAGLVRRERSPSDGRSSVVTLTDAGRAAVESAFREDMTSELALLARLDPKKRATLARLLGELLLAIEAAPP